MVANDVAVPLLSFGVFFGVFYTAWYNAERITNRDRLAVWFSCMYHVIKYLLLVLSLLVMTIVSNKTVLYNNCNNSY